MEQILSNNKKLKKIQKEIINLKKTGNKHGDNLNKLHGKMLNLEGEKFEKMVANKISNIFCIPYLENITTTKNFPMEYADLSFNKTLNFTSCLSTFLDEAKYLHYKEIQDDKPVCRTKLELYKTGFIKELEDSRSELAEIEKEIKRKKLNSNLSDSGNSVELSGSLSESAKLSDYSQKSTEKKKKSEEFPANLRNLHQIEIDIAIKTVPGEYVLKLLDSFKNDQSLNQEFINNIKHIDPNAKYNILMEVGKNSLNDALVKTFQMLKIIYLVRSLKSIYSLEKTKLTKSTKYIYDILGVDISHDFVFFLITNGSKKEFLDIPTDADQFKSNVTDKKELRKQKTYQCLKVLKDRIKDEFVYICYVDDYLQNPDEEKKEMIERIGKLEEEMKEKEKDNREKLEIQLKENIDLNAKLGKQANDIIDLYAKLEIQLKENKDLNAKLEIQLKEDKDLNETWKNDKKDLIEKLDNQAKENSRLKATLETQKYEFNEQLEEKMKEQKSELWLLFEQQMKNLEDKYQQK